MTTDRDILEAGIGPEATVTYDRDADALYVYIPGREHMRVDHTKSFDDRVQIDYDAAGTIIGIEILGVSLLPSPSAPAEEP